VLGPRALSARTAAQSSRPHYVGAASGEQLFKVFCLLQKPLGDCGFTVLRVDREGFGESVGMRHPVTGDYSPRPLEPLLLRAEVERHLGISRAGLWRLVKAGDLPAIHIGRRVRFRRDDLDEFLRARRSGARKAA
jgi:excisionase family DNA binding protein